MASAERIRHYGMDLKLAAKNHRAGVFDLPHQSQNG
jgi:hypothetical protein